MEKFEVWLETAKPNEGDRFIIFDGGNFEIGDYDIHAEMPGYFDTKWVFHGYIFPNRKNLRITDFTVTNERKFPFASQPEHKEAVNFRKSVWRNIAPEITPGLQKMIQKGVITPQWMVISYLNNQEFKVSEVLFVKSLSTSQGDEAEKQWTADREEEGRKLGAAYNQKDPKVLFKNKEINPSAWFGRYGESVDPVIKWYDFEENPFEGPGEGEDCVAVLSDGSKVVFDFTGSGYVKITYNNKSPRKEIGDAIKSFADVNPDEKLDGMYLDRYLDFYKEVRPNIYQRFEPQPGDRVGEGDTYEPEQEPNLADYMMRKSQASYPGGTSNQITPSTGYVLADGRTITMGRMGKRDDDHRLMSPSEKAIQRWGWPKVDSETEKMYELMRRSGAVRIMVSDPFVINLIKPMTRAQKTIIRNYIETKGVKEVLVSFVGGKEYEFTTKDHRQMDRYL